MRLGDQLIHLAEVLSAASGRSEARIANLAGCDARIFERLRNDGSCTIATFERVVEWFGLNWPADLPWPSEVARTAVPEPA